MIVVGSVLALWTVTGASPNVDHPRWRFLTIGTVLSVLVWLLASGAFAVYVSMFGSYNKAWGRSPP